MQAFHWEEPMIGENESNQGDMAKNLGKEGKM